MQTIYHAPIKEENQIKNLDITFKIANLDQVVSSAAQKYSVGRPVTKVNKLYRGSVLWYFRGNGTLRLFILKANKAQIH